MLRILRPLFLVLLTFNSASAQENRVANTLPQLLGDIERVMQEEHMPGLMVSIVAHDSVVFSGGLGMADIASGKMVDGKTVFHLSSVTKMFTAQGILKLIAENKLHLQDKLSDLAPEIKHQNPWEATHPVRLVHLMEHSSGFEDVHLNMVYNTTARDLTSLAAVQFYQTCLVARWQPGVASSYASPNYTVLGYLLEKYSGLFWGQYLQQALLAPLGMQGSDVDLRINDTERYARGYRFADGAYVPFPFFVPAGNGAPSALHSCADDMTRYVRFFLNDWKINGQPWLDSSYLRMMETIHSTGAAKAGLQVGYALGNLTFYQHPKANFRGHAGLGDGFASLINYDRPHRIGYAIANNGGKSMWRISQLIEDFLTRKLPVLAPVSVVQGAPLPVLDAFAGYYKPLDGWGPWAFIQRVTGVVHVSQWKKKLVLKPLLGRPDTVEWAGGQLFRSRKDHQASVVLGSATDGTPFLQAYNTHQYYVKMPYLPVVLQRLLLGLSVLAMGLSVGWAVTWLLLVMVNKIGRPLLLVGLLPGLAVGAGVVAFNRLVATDYENRVAFNSINPTSLIIFLASLCFGVLAAAGLGLLVRQWSQLQPVWIRGVLVFNGVSLAYLTFLLATHGWIGLRTWAL